MSLSLCAAAGCDRATQLEFEEAETEFTSIAHLKSLGRGATTPLVRELKIEGVVTANDIRGEFRKRIVLEDATGGIELLVDHTALADHYPLGARVAVYCTGLALGEYGGKYQLGAMPAGDYGADRIPRAEMERYIRCVELNDGTRRPRPVTFDLLGPADADRYVRFDGVRFVEAGLPWCETDPETGLRVVTERHLIDGAGRTFTVRLLPSCHYATEPVPQGTGSVNGIVDWFNGVLSLRIINYEIDLGQR